MATSNNKNICIVFAANMNARLALDTEYNYCIACDSGVLVAELHGIVPNLIVGDFDSVSKTMLDSKYPSIPKIQYSKDKDETDLELGLIQAMKAGYECIDIVASEKGRMDHYLGMFSLLARYSAIRNVYCESYVYRILRGKVKFNIARGQLISFFCVSGEAHIERSANLRWPLDGMRLSALQPSISNEATADSVELQILQGTVISVCKHKLTV